MTRKTPIELVREILEHRIRRFDEIIGYFESLTYQADQTENFLKTYRRGFEESLEIVNNAIEFDSAKEPSTNG